MKVENGANNVFYLSLSFSMLIAVLCRLCNTVRKTSFLIHCLGDGDVDFLSIFEICLDFLAKFAFGDFNVVLGATVGSQQVEEIIVKVDLEFSQCDQKNYQLVLSTEDVRDIHVVSGGAKIFVFAAVEDLSSACQFSRIYISADQVDLGVTVLSGLGGTHFNNLRRLGNFPCEKRIKLPCKVFP